MQRIKTLLGTKKGKLIALLALVLLIGGGGGVKFLILDAPKEEAPVELVFVALEPIFAPIYKDRAFAGYVLLMLNLEIPDSRNLPLVKERITPLRDAFLSDLYLQAAMRRASDPPVDISRIKRRFLQLSEQVLGPGIVGDVLVESAVERRS